ncbi:MAG: VanZ family protein [Candidatus Omnitrophota bacterium]
MRQVWEFFGKVFGQDNVEIFCILLFLATAILILTRIIRFHFSILRSIVNLAVIIFAFIFAWRQPFFTERIHILEYGLLGWLAVRDFSRNKTPLKAVLFTMLFIFLVGSIDEFFQKLLPYRVGEIRDVITNIISGVLGIILFQCHKIIPEPAKRMEAR